MKTQCNTDDTTKLSMTKKQKETEKTLEELRELISKFPEDEKYLKEFERLEKSFIEIESNHHKLEALKDRRYVFRVILTENKITQTKLAEYMGKEISKKEYKDYTTAVEDCRTIINRILNQQEHRTGTLRILDDMTAWDLMMEALYSLTTHSTDDATTPLTFFKKEWSKHLTSFFSELSEEKADAIVDYFYECNNKWNDPYTAMR